MDESEDESNPDKDMHVHKKPVSDGILHQLSCLTTHVQWWSGEADSEISGLSYFHYCSLALITSQDIVKEHCKSAACVQPHPGHLAKISKVLEPTSHNKTAASKEKTDSSSATNNEQDDLEEDHDAKPRQKCGPGGSISEGPQPPSQLLLRDLDDFAVECFLLYYHWILTRDAFPP